MEEQSSIEAEVLACAYQHQFVENRHGKPVAINRNGSIVIQDREGRERERYTVVYGAVLEVQDGEAVASGQKLAEWDPYTYAILTDVPGTIRFHDIEPGVTMKEEVDEVTGFSRPIIVQSQDEKKHPRSWCWARGTRLSARSSCPPTPSSWCRKARRSCRETS